VSINNYVDPEDSTTFLDLKIIHLCITRALSLLAFLVKKKSPGKARKQSIPKGTITNPFEVDVPYETSIKYFEPAHG